MCMQSWLFCHSLEIYSVYLEVIGFYWKAAMPEIVCSGWNISKHLCYSAKLPHGWLRSTVFARTSEQKTKQKPQTQNKSQYTFPLSYIKKDMLISRFFCENVQENKGNNYSAIWRLIYSQSTESSQENRKLWSTEEKKNIYKCMMLRRNQMEWTDGRRDVIWSSL